VSDELQTHIRGPLGAVAANFAVGAKVAEYRLEQELGRGGMAVVFRTTDERLSRPVALKILAPALAEDEAFRQRFIRESRAAAAVDDPHIIPVFEAGEANGVLFIAMRYVPGGDVRTLLRREGPMSPARAEFADALRRALGLAPYHSSPSAAPKEHPATRIAGAAPHGGTQEKVSRVATAAKAQSPTIGAAGTRTDPASIVPAPVADKSLPRGEGSTGGERAQGTSQIKRPWKRDWTTWLLIFAPVGFITSNCHP
jgi:Protein kinase domain